MDTKGETSELQQLVSSDAENEDSIVQDDNPSEEKLVSPVRSNKVSYLITYQIQYLLFAV